MKPLTDAQRRCLRLAARKGGTTVTPPFQPVPDGHVSHQAAHALADRGLLTITTARVALITKAGRSALAAPVPERPVFLKRRDGLTDRPEHAVRGEDEVIDAHTLGPWWREQSARREAAAKERRDEARRRAREARRDAA